MLRQFSANLISNFSLFILSICMNLVLTPLYIQKIGVDGFGLIRYALIFPIYVGLATIVISASVSRFLTIEIQNNNWKNANRIFNTSFFTLLAITIILLPIIILISTNVTRYVDTGLTFDVEIIYLFFGILASSLITLFSTIFLIPSFALNRLDLYNLSNISSRFLLFLFLYLILTYVSSIDLSFIGFSYFISSIFGLLISISIWKKYSKSLKLRFKSFSYKKLTEIFKMGGWLLINQLGSILFLYVDLLVINHFFSLNEVGEYSIVQQWSVLLRSLAGLIAGVFTPLILINYAKDNFEKLLTISSSSVQFIGILMGILIGIIIGFSSELLSLWVGEEYEYLSPLLCLIVGHLSINLAVLPLFSVNSAYNKVKIPGLFSLGFGVLNLFLAIILASTLNLGLYGIALASLIVLTLKNTIFLPLYTAYIMNLKKTFFLKPIFSAVIVMLFTALLVFSVEFIIEIDRWISIIFSSIFIAVLMLIMSWYFLINRTSKKIILERLKKYT